MSDDTTQVPQEKIELPPLESADRLIAMVIKLSDTLKADETELELLGEAELPQFTIGEQSTWKI